MSDQSMAGKDPDMAGAEGDQGMSNPDEGMGNPAQTEGDMSDDALSESSDMGDGMSGDNPSGA